MHFRHTPANQNKKKGADRARGEHRVREVREIKSSGSGRKKFEFGSIEPPVTKNRSISPVLCYLAVDGRIQTFMIEKAVNPT